jgi:hypothetical protein
MENKKLLVSNTRIIQFYSKYPCLDFEKINLAVIDMIENIINTKTLDNVLATQIIQNFEELKQNLNNKSINDELNKIIKEHTEHLHDKTKLIINDSLPKNNETITNLLSLTELRLKEHLNEIKNITTVNKEKQNKLEDEIHEIINKMNGAVTKGKVSENSLENILNNMFPSAEIVRTANTKESADYILKRDNIHDIRFENKFFTSNVPTSQILKFKRDMEINNSSGIMLSQNVGITSKENFEFEIFNGNVYVYLHNVNYDPDKIKTAIDIIDHLKKETKEMNKDIFMDKQFFEKINAEFIKIIQKRDNIINLVKKNNENIMRELRDIDFPLLRDFININCGCTETKKFICNYCGFIPEKNNAKALQMHQRACKQKNKNETISDNEDV